MPLAVFERREAGSQREGLFKLPIDAILGVEQCVARGEHLVRPRRILEPHQLGGPSLGGVGRFAKVVDFHIGETCGVGGNDLRQPVEPGGNGRIGRVWPRRLIAGAFFVESTCRLLISCSRKPLGKGGSTALSQGGIGRDDE